MEYTVSVDISVTDEEMERLTKEELADLVELRVRKALFEEQKHARWVDGNDGWFNYKCCTKCGYKYLNYPVDIPLPKKCPQCNNFMKV